MRYNKSWFTLIEILVAISILSIVMISVFTAFILSADINNRVEASRVMHENIKHLTEFISEDIRKNEVLWIQDINPVSSCDLNFSSKYKDWSKLCTDNGEYYLAEFNSITNTWTRRDECDISVNCSIVFKKDGSISPVTNSWISFQSLNFTVSDSKPLRVQMNFQARPAIWKWIKPKLIETNTIDFQTTFSKRIYEEYN